MNMPDALITVKTAVDARWKTQREAAAECGIDEGLLSQALLGTGKLSLKSALRLCRGAGLPADAARVMLRPSGVETLDVLVEILAEEGRPSGIEDAADYVLSGPPQNAGGNHA